MGRHSVTPDVVPAPAAGRRVSSAVAAVAVVVVAVAFLALTVVGLGMFGISLQPRGETVTVPTSTPTPTVSRVALVRTPAQEVLASTLTGTVAPGWQPASDLSWSGGTPFDSPCGRPGVDAALTASRVFDTPGRQVVVTVSAYGAGAGAVALRDWNDVLSSCSGAQVTLRVAAAPGTEALAAGLAATGGKPAATALFWRRGDVIALVVSPGRSSVGLAADATTLDAVLLESLRSRCNVISSRLADASRSPWVATGVQGAPGAFTGLTTPVPVTLPPVPTPSPPKGVTPVPDTYTPTPLPSVSYPERPADPVWPQDLPTPVPEPVVPVRPTPVPNVTTYPSRLDDLVGPGCGWAFTGQPRPPFDQAQEAVLAQSRAQQALSDLALAQQTWQVDTLTYWEDVPVYEQQAVAFAQYARAVAQVAAAWDAITAARTAYAAALQAYNDAVAARAQFFVDQADAQAAYDAAVAACQAAGSPTATASPTTSATASPTSSTSAGPSPSTTPGCPPEIPQILLQTPPPEPTVPTPPPDPRPTG
ncbi:MAG: hypothetical protein GC157_15730 [Frankiales bacterium]|nr:hypothetical protein [Frankiales bacterium]